MKKYRYGILLRSARFKAGLTQSQVAELIGESQSYVSKYENGEQRLDLVELETVCNVLNIGLLDFIREYLESK